MIGPSLEELRPDCTSAFSAGGQRNSQASDSSGWIEATFASGADVFALVSNDWSTNTPPYSPNFHYMSINAVLSSDNGNHFTYIKGKRTLASLPIDSLAPVPGAKGFATASNIFKKDKLFYVFLGLRGGAGQQSGSCLLRTSTLLDLQKWQHWSGSDFISSGPINKEGECAPVLVPFAGPIELRSVNYFTGCSCYIGTFEGLRRTNNATESGFYYTTSTDLVSWTKPQLLLSRPLDGDCREMLVYPSLLDSHSKSRNFSSITDRPYLYYTRLNRTSCKGTPDRDLIRVPLMVTVGK